MRSNFISILMLLVLLFASIIRFLSLSTEVLFKEEIPIVLLTLLAALLVTFLPKEGQSWMKKRYLTISNIFLFSYLIVHFQENIDLLLIPSNIKRFTTYSNQFISIKTAYISLFGAISFCLGYSISRINKAIWQPRISFRNINFRSLNKLSSFFYFICLLVFIAVNGRLYLSGAYNQETLEYMSGSLSTYIVILMSACFLTNVLSVCLQFSSNNESVSLRQYLKSYSLFFYLCVGVYLFFVISFGDRGPVMTAVMIFMGGYFITSKKRISALNLVIVLIITATIISVWGLMRGDRESNISVQERTEELYSNDQTISPATAELAGSNRVAIMAVESTPSQFPYRYGLFTLNNLISIIPFSSTIVKQFGFYVPKNLAHSSAFLNWYDHGDRIAAGVGTTTVADIYLDFGWLGVIVILLLMGMLFRKIDSTVYAQPIYKLSPFLLIAFMVLFSQAIYIPRSVTLFQLRNIVWEYLIFMVLCYIVRKKA